MRVTIAGCSHVGRKLAGYDWREDLVAAWEGIVTRSRQSDFFVHLGDLFDSGRPAPRDIALALEMLDAIECPVVIMQGNHDENPGTEPGALEPLKRIRFKHELQVVDGHAVKQVGGHAFAFYAYSNDVKVREQSEGKHASAQESLDWFIDSLQRREFHSGERRVRKISLFCMHVDVKGLQYKVEETSRRVGAAADLEVLKALSFPVVCGHVHKWAVVEPNVYVPGSVLPFDFSEERTRKFCLTVDL